jgi:hypothetical protein
MRLEMMYGLRVVISSNYYFRAIDLRHHLDGECQPNSVASLMSTNTCLTAKLWSAVMVNIVTAEGTFILRYIRVSTC